MSMSLPILALIRPSLCCYGENVTRVFVEQQVKVWLSLYRTVSETIMNFFNNNTTQLVSSSQTDWRLLQNTSDVYSIGSTWANPYGLPISLTDFLKFYGHQGVSFVHFDHSFFCTTSIRPALVKWHRNNRSV